MLGNFEIKFKVVFCYKLKSYFVLLFYTYACISTLYVRAVSQGFITTRVGCDGQMFPKESFKAILLVQLHVSG